MTLLLRNKRLSLPSNSEGMGVSITDISWGNTLIVSTQGTSLGEREKLNTHFDKLEDAVAAAQNGDFILVLGGLLEINTNITVFNKKLTIYFAGTQVQINTPTNPKIVFDIQLSSIRIGGIGYSFTSSVTGTVQLIGLQNNSFLELSNFDAINLTYLATVNNSELIIKDGNSINVQGDVVRSLSVENGSTVTLQSIDTITANPPQQFAVVFNATLHIKQVESFTCSTAYLLFLGNSKAIIKDGGIHTAAGHSVALGEAAISQSGGRSELEIKNNKIVSTSGKAINITGSLNINSAKIISQGTKEAIAYTQLNATDNELVNTKLIGGSSSNLTFTSDLNSAPLLLDGVRSNTSLPTNPQIIEGTLTIDSNLS